MATLLHKKLVASCVEPKVFGGTRISGQLNPFHPKCTHFHYDKESGAGQSLYEESQVAGRATRKRT
ncbi:unnamed protein product [Brassica napus]|uniref:(rape) hypothetical protein n=1 Tax=Brassica napus TaxID=3708 RepID=A0A816IB79_BRANA|nr:unnamed protein product [Brassica napus]